MNDTEAGTYGSRLRHCRNAAGLTQTQLAAKLGLTRSSIANIEADRQRPLVEDASRTAELLGVDPAWLAFGRITLGQPPPPQPKPHDQTELARCIRDLERAAGRLRKLQQGEAS
jgi:transcriptional regulator with XRE-family HTH domain